MSSRPPGAPDVPASDESPATAQARQEVRLLLAQAEATTDKPWAARMFFEAAYLQEAALNQDKTAARTYAKSLRSDPTFQPTAWALRRQFSRHGLWENLMRVIEAEARFASNTRSQDRADLLLERALLCTQHLGKPEQGLQSLNEALQVDPRHRAAWVALVEHALWHQLPGDVERAFEGLLATARSSTETAAWTMALAEWLASPGVSHSGSHAALAVDVLVRAIDAGAGDPAVLATLDRLSLGATDERLRMAALDAFAKGLSTQSGNAEAEATQMLALREKARRLVASGNLPAAASALDQALALEPEHPVIAADRLDLAVLEGRMDVFDMWPTHSRAPEVHAELLLRRADMAARQGAWGEAMGALAAVPPEVQLDDLIFVERVRTWGGLQDAHGLAEAYEAQAHALLARIDALADGGKVAHEVAHQYVRAGSIWESELSDSVRAEALYNSALGVVPSYRPAQEGLASVFTRDGRWEKLVELVASDATTAASSGRASALRESLVLLNRDLLSDLPAALAAQAALVAADGEDPRTLFRWLDIAALLSAKDGGALGDALSAVARLQRHAQTNAGRAALWLLSARLAMGSSRDAQVDEFLDQALAADPSSLAAAFIERRSSSEPTRVRAALAKELTSALRLGQQTDVGFDAERLRALRFRQAFVALEANQVPDALVALDPLVRQGDFAAWCWQVDILRRLRDPQLLRRWLSKRDGAADAWAQPQAEHTRAELLLLLAESAELAGRATEAADAYEEALPTAQQIAQPELSVRALLGCLRTSAAKGNIVGTLAALQGLAQNTQGDLAHQFAQEGQHVLLATGGAIDETSLVPGDTGLAFMAAVRADDALRLLSSMQQIAQQTEPSAARARLSFQLAINALIAGLPAAGEHLRVSYNDDPGAPAQVVITDLLGIPEGFDSLLDHVGGARLQSLTETPASDDASSAALATLLALERASAAESDGRLGAAARAYALVVSMRPDSLEALEGLRRLAQLAGARGDEALLLERIGNALTSVGARAAHYAEAALLVEADGHTQAAIRLFYKVLSSAPNDDEAFDRLLVLLCGAADWQRVDNLLSFKLTSLGHKGPRCVPLWLRRARVRYDQLQNPEGAAADWQRILVVDANSFEALWRLGQESLGEGAPWAARTRLHLASQSACDHGSSMLHCLTDLAEVCEQQDDPAAARSALGRAVDLVSHLDATLWQRMLPLCTRLGLVDLAEQSLRSLADRSDGNARAGYLRAASQTLRDAGRIDEAVGLAAAALQADPVCDAIFDLATVPPSLPALGPVAEVVIEGMNAVLEEVSTHAMFDVRKVELLEAYARVAQQSWRQHVVAQLLFLLGQGNASGSSRAVQGQFDVDDLFSLGHLSQPLRPDPSLLAVANEVTALQAVWPTVARAAHKVFAVFADLPAGARAQRIGDETRLAGFSSAATTLGLADVALFNATSEILIMPLAAPTPALAVGPGMLAGDAGSRFRVGRALALLKLGVPFLVAPRDRATSCALVCAALGAIGANRDVITAGGSDLGLKFSRLLKKKPPRPVDPARGAVESISVAGVNAWLAQVEAAADRFGLAVAGDVPEAIFALAGSRKLSVVQTHANARALIAFALSTEYHDLRCRLGLHEERAVDV